MHFDKTILLNAIIDARRTKDYEQLTHLLLRYFAHFDNNTVYIPQGTASAMADMTEAALRTVRRYLTSLADRTILIKIDEKTLQLNDQFSNKASNTICYKGSRLVLSDEESAFVFFLETKRAEFLAAIGKNKRHVKKEDAGMNTMIVALTNQLAVKDAQIAELLAMIATKYFSDSATKDEIKTKLALVLPFKEIHD